MLVDVDPAELLPHRPPMLLVDRVVAFQPPNAAVVDRHIRRTEPCFAPTPDQIPDHLLEYPPTLVLESFAQSGGVVWQLHNRHIGQPREGLLIFGAARRIGFHRPVYCGETLRHEVELQAVYGDTAIVTGTSTANGIVVMTVDSATALMRPPGALITAT